MKNEENKIEGRNDLKFNFNNMGFMQSAFKTYRSNKYLKIIIFNFNVMYSFDSNLSMIIFIL